MLELTRETQRFRFVNVPRAPVPSLLRDFSAPVIVEYAYSDDELAFLSAHDSDGFNRWEAVQRLALARLLRLTDEVESGQEPTSIDDLVHRRRCARCCATTRCRRPSANRC